jgi:hypothetical protein
MLVALCAGFGFGLAAITAIRVAFLSARLSRLERKKTT